MLAWTRTEIKHSFVIKLAISHLQCIQILIEREMKMLQPSKTVVTMSFPALIFLRNLGSKFSPFHFSTWFWETFTIFNTLHALFWCFQRVKEALDNTESFLGSVTITQRNCKKTARGLREGAMFQNRTLIGLKDEDPQKFSSFYCKNSDNMAQNSMENNFTLAKQLSN